nr:MAG TPA: capsid protein [Caudoviricetes sp.]
MSEFENGVLGLIPQRDWLDVGFQVTRQNDPIDGLFGDERTDNLVAYWQSIAAEYQIPVMAQFHGFDTAAQTTFRMPIDTHNIEKGLIKVKINQSERMRALLRSGVVENSMYDYVVQDGVRLADQVFTRSKVAKNELMASGKVTINENNLALTVDYGVPANQTAYELDFSADADIPGQIQSLLDEATENGVTLTGVLTSRKNITRMRSNTAIQKAINSNLGAGALVRVSDLNAYMEEEFGISRIITNDLTYGSAAGIGTDGRPSIASHRYYPQDRITFFATNPNGRMGVGLWGDPPEVDGADFLRVNASGVSPYVYITQWMEKDPAVLWTKASALFMPVLYNPNSLYIARVVTDPTLGELTVKSTATNNTNETKIAITPTKEAAGNVYKYKTDPTTAPTVTYGQNVQNWTLWDGRSNVTGVTNGHAITVVEADAGYRALNAGNTTITTKQV